jgi:diguanylate cyclase (GGDEF)-like protein
LTKPASGEAVHARADGIDASVGVRRPELQVAALAALVWAATAVLFVLAPDRGSSLRHAGPWVFVVAAIAFAVFEYVIFEVEFRTEGITFSMSEIPHALTLAFLTPLGAVSARLCLSVIVLIVFRQNRRVKLFFNAGILALDTALSVMLVRLLLELWGDSDALLLASVIVAMAASSLVTSLFISLAISRFEGHARDRIVAEVAGSWWLYPVTSVLGSMTLALALVEPTLVTFASLPTAGIWFVMRSFGRRQQELRDLEALHGFAGLLGDTLDVATIGDLAASESQRLVRSAGAAIIRFTDDGPVVHCSGDVPFGFPTEARDPAWSPLLADTTVKVVTPAEFRKLGITTGQTSRSALVAPLADGGDVFAALIVHQREKLGSEFDAHDIGRAKSVADQLAVGLRRGILHERLEYEARHDSLTGLPARNLFERLVSDVVERERVGVWVVMMLDLDRFKEVNDTLGHHSGDALLIEFSRRMSALLGPDDHLARLAGDEFAILAHRATGSEALELAQSCVHEGGRPVVLDGLEIVVTVSIGVAEILEHESGAVQAMRRADIAMYNAKWQRTGVETYRDEIDRRTPARLSMLGDLRTAIEQDQLDVVYQPKIDLASGEVIGAEALVRWEHGTRGVVAPTEFVRVAEDTGLIKDLTDLVLARGIATLRRFQELDLGIGLAVNLSTHDLFDSNLPARVHGYLTENGVRPEAITLEITESSLLIDAPRTRATIDDLHRVGLRLAVDDFGTGYSSLSYLRRLPVQELKIDQSFVSGMLTDPQDEVIVRSTVDLGHNLGLRVVAEGVESLAILDRLREIGCDDAQGYAISTPLSADALIAWIRDVRTHRVGR